MIKKFFCVFLCVVFCLSLVACGEKADDTPKSDGDIKEVHEEIPLTEEEKGILEAMGSDVNVIPDEEYIETISEMRYHTADYIGRVYQVEGIFASDDEGISVYRKLINGDETETLGISLRYLEKEIPDGAWIRITGIVAEDEADDESAAVLDVVAIEALAEYGQADLQWNGFYEHQH